jgi:hypothetical protein
MEKAIFISRIKQLKFIKPDYARIYYGNEFCERLISSPSLLKEVLFYAQKNNLNFTFVTPYVTDLGLKKINSLFELLYRFQNSCEVVFNDWGVFDLARSEYPAFTLALGRLLVKQKRGPRLIELLKRKIKARFIKDKNGGKVKQILIQKKLPLSLDDYYKGANISSSTIIHDFLISHGVKRIEMDNVAQGLYLGLPQNKISVSLYLPYVYITTTFFCPTAGCAANKNNPLKIKKCGRECQRYVFKLTHKSMPKTIYLKGNTQFYINKKLSISSLAKSPVNRIVYFPELVV